MCSLCEDFVVDGKRLTRIASSKIYYSTWRSGCSFSWTETVKSLACYEAMMWVVASSHFVTLEIFLPDYRGEHLGSWLIFEFLTYFLITGLHEHCSRRGSRRKERGREGQTRHGGKHKRVEIELLACWSRSHHADQMFLLFPYRLFEATPLSCLRFVILFFCTNMICITAIIIIYLCHMNEN